MMKPGRTQDEGENDVVLDLCTKITTYKRLHSTINGSLFDVTSKLRKQTRWEQEKKEEEKGSYKKGGHTHTQQPNAPAKSSPFAFSDCGGKDEIKGNKSKSAPLSRAHVHNNTTWWSRAR